MTKKYENSIWWNIPAYLDRWRIFPRIFISMYIYLLYETVTWFMALEVPTMEQAGLISVIFSVGGFWFNSYLAAPPKKLNKNMNEINKKDNYSNTSDYNYTNEDCDIDYNYGHNNNDKLY
jgi:hypothetical protein